MLKKQKKVVRWPMMEGSWPFGTGNFCQVHGDSSLYFLRWTEKQLAKFVAFTLDAEQKNRSGTMYISILIYMGDQRDGNNAPATFVTKEFILSIQNE